jgi:hypothetical protein
MYLIALLREFAGSIKETDNAGLLFSLIFGSKRLKSNIYFLIGIINAEYELMKLYNYFNTLINY